MRYHTLLLLSVAVMLIQGLLGQTDWWTLGNNWVLSGLVTMSLVMVFDHERLAGFNNGSLFMKGWVLLTTMMNLNSIYVVPDLPWWKMDLLVIGYLALVSVGTGCWQKAVIPIRSLMFGFIIALMACLYPPTIMAILFVLLYFVYLSSYSTRNMVGLFSGVIFTYWILYCCIALWYDDTSVLTFIVDSYHQLNALEYHFPAFCLEGFTGYCFVGLTIVIVFIYAVIGFFAGNFNSLRMRSNIMLQCVVSLLLIIAMPTCWSLYLIFAFISLLVHLLFTLSDHPERISTICARLMVATYLVMSVAEPFIRWASVYVIDWYNEAAALYERYF